MSDFSGLYNLRVGKESDKNFVLATFLRGLYYGESFFSRVPKAVFFDRYKLVAQALVEDANTILRVACLPEDPDVILGYSLCSNNGETLYWVFVKTTWRKHGIARSLMPSHIKYVAHLTRLGDSLLYKLPGAEFNPFF